MATTSHEFDLGNFRVKIDVDLADGTPNGIEARWSTTGFIWVELDVPLFVERRNWREAGISDSFEGAKVAAARVCHEALAANAATLTTLAKAATSAASEADGLARALAMFA